MANTTVSLSPEGIIFPFRVDYRNKQGIRCIRWVRRHCDLLPGTMEPMNVRWIELGLDDKEHQVDPADAELYESEYIRMMDASTRSTISAIRN